MTDGMLVWLSALVKLLCSLFVPVVGFDKLIIDLIACIRLCRESQKEWR